MLCLQFCFKCTWEEKGCTETWSRTFRRGRFGDAVSRMGRFGDRTFRRWWSQMFHTEKVCFWNTSVVVTTKDVRFIRVFVAFLRASVVSLPPEVWKGLVRPWWCLEGNIACDSRHRGVFTVSGLQFAPNFFRPDLKGTVGLRLNRYFVKFDKF